MEICSNIKYKSFYLYFPDTNFRLLTNNLPKISEKNEIKYLYFYRHLKTVYDIICLEKKRSRNGKKNRNYRKNTDQLQGTVLGERIQKSDHAGDRRQRQDNKGSANTLLPPEEGYRIIHQLSGFHKNI